jgi:predicted DNA-binding transcriptional regulator YafY
MPRASQARKAQRLNQARTLLRDHAPLAEVAERLARDWSVTPRQAYRYLQRAQQLKQPVPVEDAKVSFTVKLSRRLVERLRTYAASTGLTLSEIVSRAVQAVLPKARGGGRG